MSDCHPLRRGDGIEAFSIFGLDLASGASPPSNAPRPVRSRFGNAAVIGRRRRFSAMTAALGVSLPLRTSFNAVARWLPRESILHKRPAGPPPPPPRACPPPLGACPSSGGIFGTNL